MLLCVVDKIVLSIQVSLYQCQYKAGLEIGGIVVYFPAFMTELGVRLKHVFVWTRSDGV